MSGLFGVCWHQVSQEAAERGLERVCVLSRFSLSAPVKATRPVVSSTQFVAVCYGTELFHFSEPFQHFLAFIISLSYRRNVVQRGRGQAKVTLVPVFRAVMIAKLPPVRKGAGRGQTGEAGGSGRDPVAPPPLQRARHSARRQAPPVQLHQVIHRFNPSSERLPHHRSS